MKFYATENSPAALWRPGRKDSGDALDTHKIGFIVTTKQDIVLHLIGGGGGVDELVVAYVDARMGGGKVNDVLSNSQRLLWRVRTSHRCINPDSTPH